MEIDPVSSLIWPSYRCRGIVQAAPICEIGDSGGSLFVLVKPYGDDRVEIFRPTEPAMAARANVGDYAVIYRDGFRSISPRDVFEEGYFIINESEDTPG
jgi:hypothetical protein